MFKSLICIKQQSISSTEMGFFFHITIEHFLITLKYIQLDTNIILFRLIHFQGFFSIMQYVLDGIYSMQNIKCVPMLLS